MNSFLKILFGVLIGVFFTLSISMLYRTYWERDYIIRPTRTIELSHTDINQTVSELKILNNNFAEKLLSVNKRLDDFLVFGGMIITLLLAIVVSIYLRTESEVEKHFKQNFKDHMKTMENYVRDAGTLLGQIKAIYDSTSNNLKSPQPTQNDDTTDESTTS